MKPSSPLQRNRSSLFRFPDINNQTIDLPLPPKLHKSSIPSSWILILPLMGFGMIALFYVVRALTTPDQSIIFALPLMLLALATIFGTLITQRYRLREDQKIRSNESLAYLYSLQRLIVRLQATHDLIRYEATIHTPDPETLNQILNTRSLTNDLYQAETSSTRIRIGLGDIPSPMKIRIPEALAPDSEWGPILYAIQSRFRQISQTSIMHDFDKIPLLNVVCPPALQIPIARSALMQIISARRQQLYKIVCISDHPADWAFLQNLPSTSRSQLYLLREKEFSMNLITEQLLPNESLILLMQNYPHPDFLNDLDSYPSATLIFSRNPLQFSNMSLCLVSDHHEFKLYTPFTNQESTGKSLDYIDQQTFDFWIDSISRVQISAYAMQNLLPNFISFFDMKGIKTRADISTIIQERWFSNLGSANLPKPVSIALKGAKEIFDLDLSETAHGPHGVLAGTTGSGKSEWLQTLVCSLALEHHPLLLNFLLIDFKGGSSFGELVHLPHTVGLVTNLDTRLVYRALVALRTELENRQKILQELNLPDIGRYHKFYSKTSQHLDSAEYIPIPHLIVVIDEFAQLAREMPSMMAEIVRIARQGRSLGIHLIIGTQNPAEVVTEKIFTNLQFRLCLRVQTVEASRALIRHNDAASIPTNLPGRAYLLVGDNEYFLQLQTASVSAMYDEKTNTRDTFMEWIQEDGSLVDLLTLTVKPPDFEKRSSVTLMTQRDLIVQEVSKYSVRPPDKILLAPLPENLLFRDLYPPAYSWDGHQWHGSQSRVPIGVFDDIAQRLQDTYFIPFDYSETVLAGHILFYGGVGRGKTSALIALAYSLVHCFHPDDLNIYTIGFSGNPFQKLSAFPHIETNTLGFDHERLRRLMIRISSMIEQRQYQPNLKHPTIIVMVDSFELFREINQNHFLVNLETLLRTGRNVNVYFCFTASAKMVIPERLRLLFTQSFDLGGSEDLKSQYEDSFQADLLPIGSALESHSKRFVQLFNSTHIDYEQTGQAMQQAYLREKGISKSVPSVQRLPEQILLDDLNFENENKHALIIGLNDDDHLSPHYLPIDQIGKHILVLGTRMSGKTSLIRLILLSMARQLDPQYGRVILVDLIGRSFQNFTSMRHVLEYVRSPEQFIELISHLKNELLHISQLNQPYLTLLVIDDYDALVDALGGSHQAIFQDLLNLLRQYSASGFSTIIAGDFERVSDPFIKHLFLRRNAYVLGNRDYLSKLNLRVPALMYETLPPGRAIYVGDDSPQLVQIAHVDDIPTYIRYVDAIWLQSAHWLAKNTPVETEKIRTDSPFSSEEFKIDIDGLIDDLLGIEADE
ncbi:type VII secretion protein EssC [Anaerolineales bacterium]